MRLCYWPAIACASAAVRVKCMHSKLPAEKVYGSEPKHHVHLLSSFLQDGT